VDVALDAQKQRPRIAGQMLPEMALQRGEIEGFVGDNRCHAGAAFTAAHRHAIDVGAVYTVELAEHVLNLGRRDVLAFPTKSIANAVDKIEISLLVLAHEGGGAKPGIILLEYVAQNLAVAVARTGIAFEPGARLVGLLEYLSDHLADFVYSAFHAETVRITHRLRTLGIVAHQLGREATGGPPRQPPDRSWFAVKIKQEHVAFGGAIELDDLRNAEAFLEVAPDFLAQPVAAGKPQSMRALLRMRRGIEQIPAELADIKEERAVPACNVVPELACRKPVADDYRAPANKDRAGRQQPAGGVIKRKAIVHAVAGARVHDARKGMGCEHHTIMRHARRFREAGRAGRINVKRAVLEGQMRPLRCRKIRSGQALDFKIDAREIAIFPMQPDLGVTGNVGAGVLKFAHQFASHNDVLGAHHIDAVGKRCTYQVGVEKRDHPAGGGNADPYRQELGPSGHEQRDRVAFADVERQGPARVLVRPRVKLAEAEFLAIRKKRRRIPVARRELRNKQREDVLGISGKRRRHAQRASCTAQRCQFGIESLDYSHHDARRPSCRDSLQDWE